jgi:hypothetical protein
MATNEPLTATQPLESEMTKPIGMQNDQANKKFDPLAPANSLEPEMTASKEMQNYQANKKFDPLAPAKSLLPEMTKPTGMQTASVTNSTNNAAPVATPAPTQPGMLGTIYQAPNAQTVQGVDGTVKGQVNDIIDQNSPLMQRAADRANMQANSRGLLNSSMAVGAAQGAVMDAATPIAQADAASVNNINQVNTASLNNSTQFNAESANKFSLTDYTANADRQTKELVSRMDANTKMLVQSSASAASSFMTYLEQIQKVQNGTGTEAEKTADIQNLYRGMSDTMKILGEIGGLKTSTGESLASLLVDPTQT